jgi:diacylglycerol kinase family enzyme
VKAFVVLNPHAGTAASFSVQQLRRQIAAKLADRHVDATIVPATRDAVAPVVRRAAEPSEPTAAFDAIVVGGGDGTVNAAASVLAERSLPLGILPLGTFNHFARDLGLPLDLDSALDVIARGRTRRVDIGEVNGRVFVNNSSLGLYPQLVVEREHAQDRGLAKPLAAAIGLSRALWHLPSPWLRISAAGWESARRTPCLFVGNNFYAVEAPAVGRRADLDKGELCLYVVNRRSRLALLGLAIRAVMGRLDLTRDATLARLTEVEVSSPRHRLRVAIDGESVRLPSPLRYRIRPRALEVLVP